MARPALARHAAALSARLGVTVAPSTRLDEALTHSSASSRARPDNQRLEFLGDRVLGLVIADLLLARHPDEPEGKLAPRFNALVRKETCAECAVEAGLGDLIRLGKSESTTGGRRKTAILGDAMEALIAAIYLDNGVEDARRAILALWGDRLADAGAAPVDAKTALQEWAQARGQATPVYDTVGRSGPDHAPIFTITANMETGESATAAAPSKRAAQQAAAAELLARLEKSHD